MTVEPLRLQKLLERLVGADIRFVLVGGLAVGAWGYVRGTKDVDVVPDPAPENLERLAALLRDLGGRAPLNVLQGLPQVPPFAELDAQATEVEIGGFGVRVCSFDHLVAMKRESERPRDRDDLESLEAAQPPDEEQG